MNISLKETLPSKEVIYCFLCHDEMNMDVDYAITKCKLVLHTSCLVRYTVKKSRNGMVCDPFSPCGKILCIYPSSVPEIVPSGSRDNPFVLDDECEMADVSALTEEDYHDSDDETEAVFETESMISFESVIVHEKKKVKTIYEVPMTGAGPAPIERITSKNRINMRRFTENEAKDMYFCSICGSDSGENNVYDNPNVVLCKYGRCPNATWNIKKPL